MTRGMPSREDKYGTRPQRNGELVAHGNGDLGLAIGRDTMKPIFDFIGKKAHVQPFMVWYAPYLPHLPFDAPKRFEQHYDNPQLSESLLGYYAQITRFDESVGKLVQHIEDKGLAENTVFLFISDNGYRPSEDGTKVTANSSRSKWSPYEDGIRTPILIRWDGKIQPSNHLNLVQAIDLVPTILDAAGLTHEITPRMKGISLIPSASGSKSLPDRPAFGAIYPNDAQSLGEPGKHVVMRWIRLGDHKLIIPTSARESARLFDLSADPLETTNLALQSDWSDRVSILKKRLDKWWMP